MFVFVKEEDYIHRYSLSMPDESLELYYEPYYKHGKETQMDALNRLLKKFEPEKIAINTSMNFSFNDGLSMGIYTMFLESLRNGWIV